MSYIVGLTGGIATGKSHVSSVLRELGATVIDADQISHDLTQQGGPAITLIRKTFGERYIHEGCLDRKALGELVFGNEEALERLNSLMHPLIKAEMNRQITQVQYQKVTVIVLDVPLLFEVGLETLCDEVWCTWIPQSIQLERLMARDGLSQRSALARMRSQMSAWQKRLRSDRWIDTRGTLEETAAITKAMYESLIRRITREQL